MDEQNVKQNYPRSLYLKGWDDLSATVIVQNEEEEAEARKQGYKRLNEEAEAPKAEAKKAK